ncbi:endopeptidase La [Gilvimarinus sp. F26214L]|uniref:endopeptidase La n=1 Tax=Gilvimarinus sp. DZF01 TaxID=3461371 RepID=UPI0040466A27
MSTETEILPLLPIKEMVLMVHMEHPVVVGRPRSIAAVETALAGEEKTLVVVAQRDSTADNPQLDDLYRVGTRALIRRMERQANNTIAISLRGLERVEIQDVDSTQAYLQARFSPMALPTDTGDEVEALHRDILEQANQIDQLMTSDWPKGLLPQMLQSLKDPLDHVYVLASLLKLNLAQQQAIHEARTRLQALRLAHEYLNHEVQVLTIQQEIAKQAASNVSQEQRHYMLRKQMAAIQKELGEQNPEEAEVEELRQQLEDARLPDAAETVVQRELERLQRTPPAAQDHQLLRAYLELIAELPWNKSTEDKLDLQRAREILDEDHFDLREVKERIIEHLAVRKLNPKTRGAILCFVGGPGVGKTSLGASIARALGKQFERISLGGLHDEAELRGHRRTYIGAMPGRIIQAIRRQGVNNPLILLDEVDKLGRDYRGDPSAALMEILDPSQNFEFRDNYLDLPFDLSKVFFVATANTLDTIPKPLLDRMEVLRLSGYTEEEKVQIAQRYLVPRAMEEVNLPPDRIGIPGAVLEHVVRRYTREAGVRELSRQVARVVRKVAVQFAEGRQEPIQVDVSQLPELLGPERFFVEELRKELSPGITTGLAWTEAGGDVLFVEAVLMPGGRGGLTLTGQLGDVMKESAQTAKSYLWSQAEKLGITPQTFQDDGIHVHVPAGAIPKDGPSAGVTMATSMVSLLTGRPARGDTAMTGEITLAGLVLPVGGVKEKALAARRAGIRRIILPKDNLKDLNEIDEVIRKEIEFIPVRNLDEVFHAALSQNGA